MRCCLKADDSLREGSRVEEKNDGLPGRSDAYDILHREDKTLRIPITLLSLPLSSPGPGIFMRKFLQFLGFAPTEQDKKMIALVNQSYSSTRVVGRGTVKIDPSEVSQCEHVKRARLYAKEIVTGQYFA